LPITTAETEGAGSTFYDNVAAPVTFDFSGLNGPNEIAVDRGGAFEADTYTLGNFGTDNGYFLPVNAGVVPVAFTTATSQTFQIFNSNALNVATINFGSGAYNIVDPNTAGVGPPVAGTVGSHGVFAYVQTAQNGAGLNSGLSHTPNEAQWAAISYSLAGDTLTFAKDPVSSLHDDATTPTTVTAGIQAGLLNPVHSATFFSDAAGNTFVFDHGDSNAISVTSADALVELVGVAYTAAASTLSVHHVITLG
jgi:hypothetical protein